MPAEQQRTALVESVGVYHDNAPLLLDLYCGEGGCSVGYNRAGFNVVGVDAEPKKRYPFGQVVCDAITAMRRLLDGFSITTDDGDSFFLSDLAAIHASPPCQGYSRLKTVRRFKTKEHPQLIEPTRNLLAESGLPWVIENVPGSNMGTHVILCGSMFGLGAYCDGRFHQLRRHREFDCSFFFLMPLRCNHVGRPVGVYGNGGAHRRIKGEPGINGFTGNAAQRRCAMGIDWMTRYGLSQAIPTAYTQFIGQQLMRVLESR